jgi:hypothetical protein
LGPLLLLVYINDLPKAIEHKAIPILYIDDISILIITPKNIHFQNELNIDFGQLNTRFKANLHFLNFDRTYFIQLTNKSTRTSDMPIMREDK